MPDRPRYLLLVSERRLESLAGRLARLGVTDAAGAERRLEGHDLGDGLLDALGTVADPDLALAGLLRLIETTDIRAELAEDTTARDRLLVVFGVSAALADHVARHPDHWRVLAGPDAVRRPGADELRDTLLGAVGADPADATPRASVPEPMLALRVAYRKALLHLAGRDLAHELDVEDVAAELADLASAALEAGLAIARADLGERADLCRLAVIGMGKCGGRELNYVSDVDVVFVAEPAPGQDEDAALRAAAKLASGMMRACSETTAEGALWEVDAALRPEGRAGPLVRTLASHQAYYERWAKTWEFQALLKARPIAGDRKLGEEYVQTLAPLVWSAAGRDNFVEDVQAMRRRVEEHIAPEQAGRQLKLGPGGLRDVEFAVQLLQLVHGRADEDLRGPGTLIALKKLSWGGYVGRERRRGARHRVPLPAARRAPDPAAPAAAQRICVPEDQDDLRRLGRALGFRADPVREFTAEWRRHAREVRRLHEKLFYRPLLQAVARLPGEETRLTREAARTRLEALGYTDPAGALRHLEALTSGVSRRAAIQRTLLPVMLDWFADAPDPDAGLLGFRQVSDALGTTPWYLRLLRDDVTVAERMARVLASSRYATELLLRAPEAVAMLGGETGLEPRPAGALQTEAQAAVGRHVDSSAERPHHDRSADAVAAVRGLRRRELFRTAVADLLGLLDERATAEALTSITTVTLDAALRVAIDKIEGELRAPLPTRFAIDRHGPATAARAGLRQRRRRDVRARAAARRRRAGGHRPPRTRSPRSCGDCSRCPPPTRRW